MWTEFNCNIAAFSDLQRWLSLYAAQESEWSGKRWEIQFGGTHHKGTHRLWIDILYNGLLVHKILLNLGREFDPIQIQQVTPIDENNKIYPVVKEWQSIYLNSISNRVTETKLVQPSGGKSNVK